MRSPVRRDTHTSTPVQLARVTPDRWNLYVSCLFLVCAGLVFGQLLAAQFVNFDDPDYVTANPMVRSGLSLAGLAWAFSPHSANWIPLTWLSHMLDWQLFGDRAGYHHLVSVGLHVASSLLLFLLLKSLTGARWRSAAVAFLFAFHPVHVESVAWISERKDVLCGFFWLLTLWLYARYVRKPSAAAYLLALGAFALGLLSKQMIVTLPFTLLLLDFWPLGRLRERARWPGAIREKLPFVALAVAAAGVAYWSQASGGEVNSQPFGLRLENAVTSYAVYLGNLLWPAKLAVFYPFPKQIALWQAGAAALLLAALSASAVAAWRKRPYWTAGWFWFLITLLPVVGLVEVGAQAHADRYLYIPSVGLLIALVWACGDAASRWPAAKRALVPAAAIVCAACLLLSWNQTSYWRGSEPLMRQAIEATDGNYLAYLNLGRALKDRGDLDEAVHCYETALRIAPDYPEALVNMSAVRLEQGRAADAIRYAELALRQRSDQPDAHANLGIAYGMLGRPEDSIAEFRKTLAVQPGNGKIHSELGAALAAAGQNGEALEHLEEAVRLSPDFADGHHNLGRMYLMLGRQQEAVDQFRMVVQEQPDDPRGHNNLGITLGNMGDLAGAAQQFEEAIRLQPESAEAHANLGAALAQQGQIEAAIGEFREALRRDPDNANVKRGLATALEISRQTNQ